MKEEIDLKIGIIFDLDGTIIDDIELLTGLPLLAAEEFKLEISDEKMKKLKSQMLDTVSGRKKIEESILLKVILRLMGRSDSSLFVNILLQTAKELGIPRKKWSNFLKTAKKIYENNIGKLPIFEGAGETIDLLKSKYKVEVGICTTSSKSEIVDRFIGREDFLIRFNDDDNILGRDSVDNPKPAPDGILKLSKKWDIPPKNIVMVGDMEMDILAGKNAGCVTIGVLCGFADKERMNSFSPDFIMDDINGIPDIMPQIIKDMKN